jgi:ribosomal protein L18E
VDSQQKDIEQLLSEISEKAEHRYWKDVAEKMSQSPEYQASVEMTDRIYEDFEKNTTAEQKREAMEKALRIITGAINIA